MTKLATARRLSRWQWQILLAAGFLLPLLSLALPIFGFKRVLAWQKPSKPYKKSALAPQALAALLALVIRYHPIPSKCLARSILLWRFLAAEAIPAHLVIGVKKDTALLAHAWVEYQGMPLNDKVERIAEYQVIFTNAV